MIRLESPSLTHTQSPPEESVSVPLKGLRLPFGRTRNPSATMLREVEVPEAMVLHTTAPFTLEDVRAKPETLRNHIARAWGMTIPGDVDVAVFPKILRVGVPDHFVWPWVWEFFEAHNKKAMKIEAPWPNEVWGNTLWVDGRPAKEFVVLPLKERDLEFSFTPYRMKERLEIESGGNNRPSRRFIASEQITDPVTS